MLSGFEMSFTHTFSNIVNYHITYSAEEFLTICIKYACALFSPGFWADIALVSRVWIFWETKGKQGKDFSPQNQGMALTIKVQRLFSSDKFMGVFFQAADKSFH